MARFGKRVSCEMPNRKERTILRLSPLHGTMDKTRETP